MSLIQVILWVLGALIIASISALVYLNFYRRYDELESKIITSISSYANEIYELLDRMFKRVPLNRIYLMILIPTLVLGLFGLSIGFQVGLLPGIIMGMILGYVGFQIPGKVVKFIFNARLKKFDKQLVDALNLMSSALKSGLSFMQVVQVIEKEMPSPCSEEFALVIKENRVGVNLNDALLNMVKRVPSDDLFMIINSVVTLSQQGGDLSEAFETIAFTIRERQRVAEKIKTLAQAGTTQALILSSIPFFFMFMQYNIQPEYVKLMFTTPVGLILLALMCTSISIGALWMKKILTIEI